MTGNETGPSAGGARSFRRRSLVYASGVGQLDWRFARGTRTRDVHVTFDVDLSKWLMTGERMWVIKEMVDEQGNIVVLVVAMNNRIPLTFINWISGAAPPISPCG